MQADPSAPLPIPRRAMVFHGEGIRFAPGWETRLTGLGIQRGGQWTTFSGGEAITAAPITSAFRIALPEGQRVYFKRYVYPAESDRYYWLVPSKAVVEAWAFSFLHALGIPTIQTLAVGELRRFGRVRAAFIVTLEAANTLNLEEYAQQVWSKLPPAQQWEQALRIAGVLFRQLRRAHGNGFYHYDLKWRNLLLKQDGEEFTIIWIDAPRSRKAKPNSQRGRLVDLGSLARLATAYFNHRQQHELLASYLQEPLGSAELKRWVRRIHKYLSRRLPEHLKR